MDRRGLTEASRPSESLDDAVHRRSNTEQCAPEEEGEEEEEKNHGCTFQGSTTIHSVKTLHQSERVQTIIFYLQPG